MTDDELLHKFTLTKRLSEQLPSEPSSPIEPLPTFSLSKSDMCRRCHEPLTEDRFAVCPACDEAVMAEVTARDARDRAEAIARRLRMSGLPRDYVSGDRSIGSLPMSCADAMTACQMLGKTPGEGISGLYLTGDAGAYKTSLAASFLASQIRAGGSGRYVFVPDLFTDLYAIYASNDRRSRADIVDGLVTTPCLVLDDLGKEKASDHAASVLLEILDNRYRERAKGRWMIVTSNLTIEQLTGRFEADTGEPIARRLAEMTVSVTMERRAA